jgi:hypothetical protein
VRPGVLRVLGLGRGRGLGLGLPRVLGPGEGEGLRPLLLPPLPPLVRVGGKG